MRAVAAAVSRRNVKPALGYSARIQRASLQIRPLAIAADVGHGQVRLSSPLTTERSPEQERAALSEYTRMAKATQRLLGLQSLTPSSVQELRVVFHYWVGTRSRRILAAKHSEEKAIWNAEELLEWMLETHNDPGVLQNVFRTDVCASGAIINMLEQYLVPFRGTHQSFIAGSDRRIRFQRNVSELKNALLNATKLMDRLQLLHDDPNFRELVPDRFTCNMTLNLWVKRCFLLAEHGDSMDDEFVRTALKGVTSVEECLEAMQAYQKSLPVPTADGYTLLLTAWVNSGLPNRANEAHALLRKLEQDDPSVASYIAAYNTVLYAYASLAVKDKRNASHALDLFRYMQTKGIQCDATTYSTVILAHANSGDREKAINLLTQMEEEAEKTKVFPNTICYNIGELTIVALSCHVLPIFLITFIRNEQSSSLSRKV
jgi:pentatricopeptide repeat protein